MAGQAYDKASIRFTIDVENFKFMQEKGFHYDASEGGHAQHNGTELFHDTRDRSVKEKPSNNIDRN